MSDIDDYSTSSDSDSESEEKDLNLKFKNKFLNKNVPIYDESIVIENSDDEVDEMTDDENDQDENKNGNNEVDDIEEVGDDVGENKLGYDSNDENIEYNEDQDDDDNDDDDDDELDDGEGLTAIKSGGATTKKNISQSQSNNKINIESLNSDEDSDNEDENYLQKFSSEINTNYVSEFHPECLNHNYDEISALSKVTRDEFNIIIDPLHKTIPYLTKYEKALILGQRSKQIECGAKPLVKVPENIIDSYIIAELELQQKKIPFIIRRPLPNGGSEYWNLKDLEVITF